MNNWIVKKYADVWAAADWPFKLVGPTSLAVVAGTVTVALPSDCFKPHYIFTDADAPLTYLDPRQFFQTFGTLAATSSGVPTHYTFLDGNIYFGPTPSASATFKLVYERVLSVFTAANAYVAGSWDKATTTQKPVWHDGFHYCLVHGVASMGLGLLGSADAEWHRDEFVKEVAQMVQFYAPLGKAENLQFQRDLLE